MARRLAVVLGVLSGLGLSACGTPSADLFVVQRSGSIPGARLTLKVSDGGFVTCNGGEQREMSSAQLIEARALVHLLQGDDEKGHDQGVDGPIDRDLVLPPGPRSILRYRVRGEEGAVAFSDTSRGQPPVFYRLALLTRQLAKGVCGLPR